MDLFQTEIELGLGRSKGMEAKLNKYSGTLFIEDMKNLPETTENYRSKVNE